MSRKKSGSGLIEALREIGAIDENGAKALAEARAQHPGEATSDLAIEMGLASEEDIEHAKALQATGGEVTSDLLIDSMQRATSRLASAARASMSLGAVAANIIDKKV